MLKTPVLLIAFNRPDVTRKVFERIRKLQPAQLFIAVDGPRKNRPEEGELCDETRAVASLVDWDCELETLFREENVGCGRGVSEAITWFLEHVERGIILEDDCLPDPSFFTFCEEMLEYYNEESRVMHIGGTNSQFGKKRNKFSYYFSKYPHIWGWATWRRAWKHFNLHIGDDAATEEKIFSQYAFSDVEQQYWRHHFAQMRRQEIDTWDIQWTYACWANNGVTIVPGKNMISNIGFNEQATHTVRESQLSNLPTEKMDAIVHPPEIQIDVQADDATFRKYNLPHASGLGKIKDRVSYLLPETVRRTIKNILR